MAVNILMPALSPTMTEGNLTRWLKAEGERVDAGDVIAEIETDKATMEVEAVDEGVLGKILIDGGTESVPVNTVIAVLLEEGDDPANAIEVNVASTTRPSADANEEPAGASKSGLKWNKIASNDG
ncbi:MAG: biotin/lipoyl-containing protein, partial [Rhodospirillales bacterium]